MTKPHGLPPAPSSTCPALDDVRERIARAARRAGRASTDIRLIAIAKTQPAEAIRPLMAAGIVDFGENRVQEAQAKWPALMAQAENAMTLHMVGQLQSNKALEAIRLFDVLHSVDRPTLVNALGKAMAQADRWPDCFLQVALDDTPGRGGCPIPELPSLLDQAGKAGLRVVGLMAVPPLGRAPAPWFALVAEQARRLGLERLSLGMSDDFEEAILLGATDIRVGSALFGRRAPPAKAGTNLAPQI